MKDSVELKPAKVSKNKFNRHVDSENISDDTIKMLLPTPNSLKDTLKAFDDFKNKQQKCMKSCF